MPRILPGLGWRGAAGNASLEPRSSGGPDGEFHSLKAVPPVQGPPVSEHVVLKDLSVDSVSRADSPP